MKQWKMFVCERFWDENDVLKNVCKEMKIPLRKKEQMLPDTVELFQMKDETYTKIPNFGGLEDGEKVLVHVKFKQ